MSFDESWDFFLDAKVFIISTISWAFLFLFGSAVRAANIAIPTMGLLAKLFLGEGELPWGRRGVKLFDRFLCVQTLNERLRESTNIIKD